MNNDKENLVINITKKDKIYLSIIGVLVLVCFALAIVLPRPYKIVEVEKTKYESVYRNTYPTENVYMISKSSILYSEDVNYSDSLGNEYLTSFTKNFIDTGDLLGASVSYKESNGNAIQIKTLTIDKTLLELIVDETSASFGVDVKLTSTVMDSLILKFEDSLSEGYVEVVDNFLFEFEFMNAKVNVLVTYINE